VRKEPAAGGADDTLAVLTSPPLREVLPLLEKPSQNQIAEALFRTVGLERTGVGTPDSARAVVGRQLRAWGVTPERDAVVRDGSGLSRHDYVTPEALVRVLDAVRRRPTSAPSTTPSPSLASTARCATGCAARRPPATPTPRPARSTRRARSRAT
jgi:D-alanyl-D-alanine carboxypeptidase